MTISSLRLNDFFLRAAAAVAIIGPLLVIGIADTLPQGLMQGQLIVEGHLTVVAIIGATFILRAVYGMGFSTAFKLATGRSNRAVAA
jgi:hypothetical protein